MNRKNRAQSSSLFLLELILAILFFSIASAVCVQFFVKSHLMSRNARNLNYAVNECSAVAELVTASDGAQDACDLILALYEEAEIAEVYPPDVRIDYDENFIPCKAGEGTYTLLASFTEENQMLTTDIFMKEAAPGSLIYQLTVKHHLQRRPSNE